MTKLKHLLIAAASAGLIAGGASAALAAGVGGGGAAGVGAGVSAGNGGASVSASGFVSSSMAVTPGTTTDIGAAAAATGETQATLKRKKNRSIKLDGSGGANADLSAGISNN